MPMTEFAAPTIGIAPSMPAGSPRAALMAATTERSSAAGGIPFRENEESSEKFGKKSPLHVTAAAPTR